MRALPFLALALVACGNAETRPSVVTLPAQPAPPPKVAAKPEPPPPPKPAEVFDAPEAPAVRPIDPKLPVDGVALLLGANATDMWVYVDGYSAVVSRATGCATEAYVDNPLLKQLVTSETGDDPGEELAKDDVKRAIRELVGLGRRFEATDHRFAGPIHWSLDGRHIFVAVRGKLFHSRDGGKHYDEALDRPVRRLAMGKDGKHLVYEDCGKDGLSCGYMSLPTDGSRAPARFTGGQTFLMDTTGDARAMFWRTSATETCLDTFQLGTPSRESSVCQALPKVHTGPWPAQFWQDVSPGRKFGIVKWEEGRKNLVGAVALTYIVSLVDMSTNTIVKTVTDQLGQVDDEGNMLLQSMNEGGGDHTYWHPRSGPRKELARAALFAWDTKTRTAIVSGAYGKGTLGARKCLLVKSIRTP
ncbi:MAG: hypothetical protein JNM74_13640 [Myxococcales bacterium]|nr:hypothetical protein [Myxococcales bacterium]